MVAHSMQTHKKFWMGYMHVRLDRDIVTFREQLGHSLELPFNLGYMCLLALESCLFLEPISFLSASDMCSTVLLRAVREMLNKNKRGYVPGIIPLPREHRALVCHAFWMIGIGPY